MLRALQCCLIRVSFGSGEDIRCLRRECQHKQWLGFRSFACPHSGLQFRDKKRSFRAALVLDMPLDELTGDGQDLAHLSPPSTLLSTPVAMFPCVLVTPWCARARAAVHPAATIRHGRRAARITGPRLRSAGRHILIWPRCLRGVVRQFRHVSPPPPARFP